MIQTGRDNGKYWEPWTLIEGCTPVSAGCEHCWSAAATHMRSHQKNEKIRARYEGLTHPDGRFNGKIRLMWDNLDLPRRTKKPTVFAVWNDLFHQEVSEEFIANAFGNMVNCPQHIFLLLTKRVERMTDWFAGIHFQDDGIASNIYPGTTVENQAMLNLRWPYLSQIQSDHLWLSVEPMLGPIDIMQSVVTVQSRIFVGDKPGHDGNQLVIPNVVPDYSFRLTWVICGGETGPHARPMQGEWPLKLKNDCMTNGIPFWFKSWGSAHRHILKNRLLDGREWSQRPERKGE